MTAGFVTAALAAALLAGCSAGPSRAPVEPSPAPAAPRRAIGPPPAREVLVGEMCPRALQDRPAVLPLVVRRVVWSDDPAEAERAVARGEARQFAVFGWDGRRVGVFSVAGAAEAPGAASDAAVGSYAGASPCSRPAGADGDPGPHPDCVAATQHCGLGLAVLEPSGGFAARPFEEDPDPVDFAVAGGCASDGKLLVDVDGDGAAEAFPAAAFVGALRGPTEEVTAVPPDGASCEARFAQRGVVPPGDPRDWRGLDLLGVVDLDADGRREVILAYHYADRRTWAVYTARGTAARLELVGEAVPWIRR